MYTHIIPPHIELHHPVSVYFAIIFTPTRPDWKIAHSGIGHQLRAFGFKKSWAEKTHSKLSTAPFIQYWTLVNHSLEVSRTEHSMQTGKQRLTRFRYHHIYITMALDLGCNNLTTIKVHMQVTSGFFLATSEGKVIHSGKYFKNCPEVLVLTFQVSVPCKNHTTLNLKGIVHIKNKYMTLLWNTREMSFLGELSLSTNYSSSTRTISDPPPDKNVSKDQRFWGSWHWMRNSLFLLGKQIKWGFILYSEEANNLV